MKAPDRKRLWGKSANRCAHCKRPLTEPGGPAAPEIVLGEEAHIVGKNPGSARYRELPADLRDAYENRILLCPTDHAVVDGQASVWTEEALLAIKRVHEESMALRTGNAQASGLHIEMPGAVETQMIFVGAELLQLVGTALAYHFVVDDMQEAQHHAAAEAYLDTLKDYGEVFPDLAQLTERSTAASEIQDLLLEAMRDHRIVFFGALIHCDVWFGGSAERDRWPVAMLRARSAVQVAAEQKSGDASQ